MLGLLMAGSVAAQVLAGVDEPLDAVQLMSLIAACVLTFAAGVVTIALKNAPRVASCIADTDGIP
jgi:hypothetical protein